MTAWLSGRSLDGGIDEIPLPAVAGRLWLCGKRVVGPDPEAAIGRVGASLVVCLCERHELAERYPGYVSWLAAGGAGRGIWFPTPDLGTGPVADTVALLDRSVAAVRAGEGVLAHCGAGIGRAGTFAVCLLLALGVGVDEALGVVSANRPLAGPEAGAQSELVEAIAGLVAARPGRMGTEERRGRDEGT